MLGEVKAYSAEFWHSDEWGTTGLVLGRELRNGAREYGHVVWHPRGEIGSPIPRAHRTEFDGQNDAAAFCGQIVTAAARVGMPFSDQHQLIAAQAEEIRRLWALIHDLVPRVGGPAEKPRNSI